MGSCCVFSLTPVFFEYTAELTYPVPEALSGAWLTVWYNAFGTVVLLLSENKHIGVSQWVDWVLFGSCIGKFLDVPVIVDFCVFTSFCIMGS